ncbi:hypothetical protein PhCBS80983_g04830 [Powellomyces hirtus]|uniref:PH domain-containing protein n=1 Tax=Powellomyces hirtus TaxID=109895 RepID=A0A507DXY9_9FUNG|nr:hypothetical protein PhCBS80983_g04830 [Powellomyces hirtus]
MLSGPNSPVDGPHSTSTLGRTPTQFITQPHSPSGSGSDGGHLPPSPAELILTRCGGWLSLLRVLIQQFDDQTSLEKHMAQSHAKTLTTWTQHPSHEREAAFSTSIGVQDLMKNLRETCGKLAAEHEAVYSVLSAQTLPALKSLEKEVHGKMTGMMQEEKEKRKERDKDEVKLRHLIKELKQALVAASNTGEVSPWTAGDPWLFNIAVKRHIHETTLKQQNHTSSLDRLENTFGVWEKNLIKNMKSALLAYTGLTSVSASSHGATALLEQALQKLDPEHEWETYRTTQLVHSFPPSGSSANLLDDYPGANDPLVNLIKEGYLLRKSKIMKKWHENWYCLTAAGWLHEFAERPRLDISDGSAHLQPAKSLWLRSCYISELGVLGRGSASEFHITHINTHAVLSKKKHVFKFSSNSMSESEAWFAAISQFVPAGHGSHACTPSISPSTSASGLPASGDSADGRRLSSASTASSTSMIGSAGGVAHPMTQSILPESHQRAEEAPRSAETLSREPSLRREDQPLPDQPLPAQSASTGIYSSATTSVAPPPAPVDFVPPPSLHDNPAVNTSRPVSHGPDIPVQSPAAAAHDTPAAAPINPDVGPMQTTATGEEPIQPTIQPTVAREEAAPQKGNPVTNMFRHAFGGK